MDSYSINDIMKYCEINDVVTILPLMNSNIDHDLVARIQRQFDKCTQIMKKAAWSGINLRDRCGVCNKECKCIDILTCNCYMPYCKQCSCCVCSECCTVEQCSMCPDKICSMCGTSCSVCGDIICKKHIVKFSGFYYKCVNCYA